MENSDQVGEQRLPDTKFEFVHEVNNHHFGNVECIPRQFQPPAECILSRTQLDHE